MKHELELPAGFPAAAALAALIDLVPEAAIFLVDGDRNVRAWGAGAEQLLGFGAAEMIGAHCLKGIRCPRCLEGCGLEEYGRIGGALVTCHHRDGRALRFRKFARGFFEGEGADRRFVGGIEVLVPAEEAAPAERVGALGALGAVGKAGGEAAGEVFHGMISRDPQMLRAFSIIKNAAQTEATVLIRGESGTGKELAARAIHAESHRKGGPFVAVNCAAMTPSLIESELFGHVRGAFTGADRDRQGIFAQADKGTLFLDEVAELPMELQARLLRVLQERSFSPVGSSRVVRADVRVVAATHRALREEVRAGRFREDLMFRLRVVPIFLPPLRERRADVDLMLQHLIRKANERGLRRVRGIVPEAMRRLLDWPWPGNVRELQNVVDYAFAVGRSAEITLDDLPPEFRETPRISPRPARAADDDSHDGDRAPDRIDRPPADYPSANPTDPPDRGQDRADERAEAHTPSADRLRAALAAAGGNVGEAAAALGVSRPTFWRWRKKRGV